jgi:hypothetical protein
MEFFMKPKVMIPFATLRAVIWVKIADLFPIFLRKYLFIYLFYYDLLIITLVPGWSPNRGFVLCTNWTLSN